MLQRNIVVIYVANNLTGIKILGTMANQSIKLYSKGKKLKKTFVLKNVKTNLNNRVCKESLHTYKIVGYEN